MEKIISILKNDSFPGKGRESLHIIHVMRICKMLISYVKLDHTLYSINYGSCPNLCNLKHQIYCVAPCGIRDMLTPAETTYGERNNNNN